MRYNKYHAQRTVCHLGHYHPSKLESGYCDILSLQVNSGDIKEFIYQKSYDLIVNGKLICKHKPDFTVTYPDGHIEVHETKGVETMDYVIRRKLFEATIPDIPYIVIKSIRRL
jgi:hypothetical protein